MEQWIPPTQVAGEAIKPHPRFLGRLALLAGLLGVALPVVYFAPRPIESGLLLAIAVASVRLTRHALTRWTQPKMARSPWRCFPAGATRIGATAALCFALWTGAYVYHYNVSWLTAASGLLRDVRLSWIRAGVAIYDPCTPTAVSLGPSNRDDSNLNDFVRIEELDFSTGCCQERRIVLDEFHNERIVRSHYPFAYQPYNEPRLQELRQKYQLDTVVEGTKNDFEAMVRLRSWTRTQFRRADYQPHMFRFDTLAILDRNLRNDSGSAYADRDHIDPCLLFPQMYCQVLASMGHHGRFVSSEHGMSEVWSNHYRKWVLMDAEFDLHYEKQAIPLSFLELHEELASDGLRNLRIVRGTQKSGDENATYVHLRAPKLTLEILQGFFQPPLDIEMRNDWLTNAYFSGHPKRSEPAELVFVPHGSSEPTRFNHRLRSITSYKNDIYWTLNQTVILARSPTRDDQVQLAFQTVTPIFKYFEVTVDQEPPIQLSADRYTWKLHSGQNALKVTSVNQSGVKGIESRVYYSCVDTASTDGSTLPHRQ